jgi:hypothetical protein
MEYGYGIRTDIGGANDSTLKSNLQGYTKPLLEYEY